MAHVSLWDSNCFEDIPLRKLFLSSLYLFDPIFTGVGWIGRLPNYNKGICFPNTFSVIIATVAKKKKSLRKYMNLIDPNYL